MLLPFHNCTPLTKHHKRVNNLYLSIYAPLRNWEGVTGFALKRSLYGSFTIFLSTMRPLTKMKGGGGDNMVVTV